MEIKLEETIKGIRKTKNVSLESLQLLLRSGKNAEKCEKLKWKICANINLQRSHTIEEAQRLPLADFGCTPSGGYSGLVLLSFKVRDADQQERIRQIASQLPQTMLCFRGSSGLSMKIIVHFQLPNGRLPKISTHEQIFFHQHAYYMAAKYLTAELDLPPEPVSATMESRCRIGADDAAYLNAQALPFVIQQPLMPLAQAIQRGQVRQSLGGADGLGVRRLLTPMGMIPGYNEYMMNQTKFQFCYREALMRTPFQSAVGGSTDAPDDRNGISGCTDDIDLFTVTLAEQCRSNGLDQEFAVKRLLHFTPFARYETLIRGCFNSVYGAGEKGSESQLPKTAVDMLRLIQFMQRRYRFRRNAITTQTEYIEQGLCMMDWTPLTAEQVNAITISCMNEGIVVWDKDVKRYICSTYVSEYDPINGFISGLPPWDGTDRIGQLARRVPTDSPHWEDDFHKWMLGMLAQWKGMNHLHAVSMVPLFIGPQGNGKSTFCRLILPEQLRPYYTDRLDFSNRNDAEKALLRFCLINIDEYDSITKRQTAFLKHVLQKTVVTSRQLYSSYMKAQERRAVFVGTTNDMTPLSDPSGSRRYLCVRTTGKIDTYTPIDYPQTYAQLNEELGERRQHWFDHDDEVRIQAQNIEFSQYDLLQEVFLEFYRKPKKEEEGEYVSVLNMLQRLHQKYSAVKVDQVTCQKLGKWLKSQRFRNKQKHAGSYYQVISLS